MPAQNVILDSDLIHSLCLTPEKLEAAGLRKGVPLAVSLEDGRIVLRPTDPIDALCGLIAGGPSLSDELIAERRQDEERRVQKHGW
jgi:hypothetical protein